ncbi:MAG TPA: tyrosine--tRNA ligase, partial [Acidimicrobiaceae bacterium]|nr:tyrosine--tRNA ligase [Acidimicrobiaceae bacterium]
MIGDPGGRSEERNLLDDDTLRHNVECIKAQLSRLLDFDPGPYQATLVNNADWTQPVTMLEFLRDVGKHFTVNQMIAKDSVRSRIESEHGISYTEFSYMLLQANDFRHLYETHGVELQAGASDQWGNIVAGADLIRRLDARSPGLQTGAMDAPPAPNAFGLTTPLLTKADGTKYGKTESGTIWLTARQSDADTSPARTSPYALYQFLLNIPDDDVERFLKTFTFLSQSELAALMVQQRENPATRIAQRTLARSLVDMLHGEPERLAAEKAAAALFSGDVADLPPALLAEVFAAAPSSQHALSLLDGDGLPLVDLLAQTVCKSKTEARQALTDNSIAVNGTKAALADRLT